MNQSIFKIKNNQTDKVFHCHTTVGPTFGTDLRLLCLKGSGKCDHRNTIFDGYLCGNKLCGAHVYNSFNQIYWFDIINMNTFTINIE